MANTIQLRRNTNTGVVPLLSQLLVGELAFNSADNKLFISDGSAIKTINAASYIITDSVHRFVTDAQITTWNAKQDALGFTPVNVAGDTMTGALILSGPPTLANGAATKNYVDSNLSGYLTLTGGTLTGPLTLAADPTVALGAATKQYVDNSIQFISGTIAAPVQTLANLSAITAYVDKQMRLCEDSGAIFRFDAQSVDVPDGSSVIIPDNITAPAPGRWIKTSAATQDHEMLFNLSGGAVGDHLHLTTSEKNGYDSHLTNDARHLTSAQNTFLDSVNASSTEVNYLIGVTSAIQTQLDGKQATLGFTPVNVAGDTMTGLLILSGDAVSANGAVTKNQLENALIDGGTY